MGSWILYTLDGIIKWFRDILTWGVYITIQTQKAHAKNAPKPTNNTFIFCRNISHALILRVDTCSCTVRKWKVDVKKSSLEPADKAAYRLGDRGVVSCYIPDGCCSRSYIERVARLIDVILDCACRFTSPDPNTPSPRSVFPAMPLIALTY